MAVYHPVEDIRYMAVTELVKRGEIKYFEDIFQILPKTTLANHFNMNYQSWVKMIDNPQRIPMGRLMELAELFFLEIGMMAELVANSIKAKNPNHPRYKRKRSL